MKRGLKGVVILTSIICTGLLFVPASRAAHATNFLDALQTEITNRIATAGTNATQKERRALTSTAAILKRNTKTFAADLFALAAAATVLETRFPNDTTLLDLENNALAAYAAEADAQLDSAEQHLGTNSISRGLSNQLAKARAALTDANANTNGVPERARELARVFNKLRAPVAKILKKYPTIPFEAPMDLITGQNITLTETANVPQDQTKFFLHTSADNGDRFFHYTSDNPEELGTWTYERLTTTTAVVHANITFTGPDCGMPPGNNAPHDIPLTFTSATGGTFTAVNCRGETIQGTFSVD